MTIRVALADDQTVVRVGFRTLLHLTDDIVVVGEASNGLDIVQIARATRPDVVLMDIRMPIKDGVDATRLVNADPTLSAVRVLVLTTFDLDHYVVDALRAGASGFLLKDVEPSDLYRAIRAVAAGDGALSPAVSRLVIEEFTRLPAHPTAALQRLELLTERERAVITLVGQGMTNADIASALVISPLTAKTHVSRAMGKLHARDRAQLVIFAYESGLVQIGDHRTPPA